MALARARAVTAILETLTETIGDFGYRWASTEVAARWERRILLRLLRATEGDETGDELRTVVIETVAEAIGDARERGDIVATAFLELGRGGLRLVLPSGYGNDPRDGSGEVRRRGKGRR